MSARPSRWLAFSGAVAFALALGWLVIRAFELDDGELARTGMLSGPYLVSAALAFVLVSGLRAALMRDPEPRRRAFTETLLIPCVLAPLAVVFPWFVAPSHFGGALVDLPYFLDWLTRYPNLGPIHYEVALGIGALLGASAMPAFFAAHASRVPRVGPRTALAFLLLQLIAYVPVLLHLDLGALAVASITAIDGPLSLLASEREGSIELGLVIASGPLLRLAATAAMLAMAIRALAHRETPVWEMS